MTRYKRNLNQDVTHWTVTGSDGFGGFLYGTPTLLAGRWEEKTEMFLTVNGEEAVSQAIVYLMDDIDAGDWLALGDFATAPTADPSTLDEAHRIQQRNRSTDLRNLIALRKAYC